VQIESQKWPLDLLVPCEISTLAISALKTFLLDWDRNAQIADFGRNVLSEFAPHPSEFVDCTRVLWLFFLFGERFFRIHNADQTRIANDSGHDTHARISR
jgi:hypothetical protein